MYRLGSDRLGMARPGRLILFVCTLLLSSVCSAAPMEVVALFKDRAVLRTPAGQEMLKLGETSASGITLLQADTQGAKVRYQDKIYELSLSSRVASTFAVPTQRSVHINRDEYDQYRMRGAINGHYVNFLVDTGASVVALSERHANMMGLDFRAGEAGAVQTAQGSASAYFLHLDRVTLGAISAQHVPATVIVGEYPVDVLLGMSFLAKFRLTDDDGVLTLTAKY